MQVFLNTDGGARGNPGPAGIGYVVRDEAGVVIAEKGEAIGTATNNVAEYKALIAGLTACKTLGATGVEARLDSELVVRQLQGIYKVKEPQLRLLADEALRLARTIEKVTYTHVRREQNSDADKLVNQALDAAAF